MYETQNTEKIGKPMQLIIRVSEWVPAREAQRIFQVCKYK